MPDDKAGQVIFSFLIFWAAVLSPQDLKSLDPILHDSRSVHPFIAEWALAILLSRIPDESGTGLVKDIYGNEYENDLLKYWYAPEGYNFGIRNGTIREDFILGEEIGANITPTVYHYWRPWSIWTDGLEGDYLSEHLQWDSALKRAFVLRQPDEADNNSWGIMSFWDAAKAYYSMGRKGVSFFYFGRLIHLLGDMSVPAHTLNSGHLGILFNQGDENYEEYCKNFSWDWVKHINEISKQDILAFEGKLEEPLTWSTFPDEITNSSEEIKKALRIFYTLAKHASQFESDNSDGHSYGSGDDAGVLKSDHDREDPPWYQDDESLVSDNPNRMDLTDTRCLMIAEKMMPYAVMATGLMIETFAKHLDNKSPLTTVKVNGELIEGNGLTKRFSSGRISIEISAVDRGNADMPTAGLSRVNFRYAKDGETHFPWINTYEGTAFYLTEPGLYKFEYYAVDNLGNLEKIEDDDNRLGEIKHFWINIGGVMPSVTMFPVNGRINEIIRNKGIAFSPQKNATATIFSNNPDDQPRRIVLDGYGGFSYAWTAKTAGTYTWWAVDDLLGKKSNVISYRISEESLCVLSDPGPPDGPTSGKTGKSYVFVSGKSSCSNGHELEYQFDWGNGTISNWSIHNSGCSAWTGTGAYVVKTRTRCAVNTNIVSNWSTGKRITISPHR